MKNPFLLLFLLSTGWFFTACGPKTIIDSEPKSILQILPDHSDLSILRTAILRTGLDMEVDGTNSITLFAPTNAAFTDFLAAKGYAQIEDVPLADLKLVLQYLLAPGILNAQQSTSGSLNTLATATPAAKPFQLYFINDGGLSVNGAPLVSVDISALNGVIQVVDKVLPLPTVATPLQYNPSLHIFLQALTRADLGIDYLTTLSEGGTFTVFAPTDQAFNAFFTEKGYANLAAIPAGTLNAIIQYHLVPNVNLTAADLLNLPELSTLDGKKISLANGTKFTDLQARTANLIALDAQTTNGVVQGLDKVLLPN